jgi:hypothetical protein
VKVGDLVRSRHGVVGIVTGVGWTGVCPSYEKSPFRNPDIHVMTTGGHCVWSYNAAEIISEAR